MPTSIDQRAHQLWNAGISILPITPASADGDKKPALSWKRLQTSRLTETELNTWFNGTSNYGLGVVMGEVSGDLMMIELEGRGAQHLPLLTQTATDSGLGELWTRLFQWAETTPSGGWHFYIKAPGNTHGNRKLAKNKTGEVIAETRENGGYSVVAPTDGQRFHHTHNSAWAFVSESDPTMLTPFTLDELDAILTVFKTIDETPRPTKPGTPQLTITGNNARVDGVSPLDDFESKTSWNEILQPHGWTPLFTRGAETFWRRPGKTTGISASTGHANDRDRLWVWTTSTDFEAEVPYTKQGAYALLEHGGDHSKAAKYLYEKGFGEQAKRVRDATEISFDKWIREGAPAITPAPAPVAEPVAAPAPAVLEPAEYTLTDDGNALRFQDAFTSIYRYIPEHKSWSFWNGHVWDLDGADAQVAEAARNLARTFPAQDKAEQAHRRRSLGANSIRNMLALAKNAQGIYTPLTVFDTDPYLLNTPAGPVNLKTRKVTPATPKGLFMRSTTVKPDWDMPTPKWLNFLAQTFVSTDLNAGKEVTDYVQRLIGLALIGKVHEQILPFFHGTGANGKTTMLNVVQHILGTGPTGYTITSPSELLTASDRHPTEIAALAGARLAVISELEEGKRIAEAKVKQLTGGDVITARFMGKDFFTFAPSHTLIVLTNSVPETTSGGSPALWRRVRRVPFLNVVPKKDRNPNLEAELMMEAPGILAWMIDGTTKYLESGLREPVVVEQATAEYESDQDTVAQWIGSGAVDLVEPSVYSQAPAGRVYSVYERWCRVNGVQPVASNAFGRRLKPFGVNSVRSHGKRLYEGLRIQEDLDSELS
ncbi:phage/plasmid primase, P4 family [Arcanobacterium buesumense]|uniref:DNA primase n=1 Tax=Arcanobacterium buesumense TaxID=2722751 RepID=A0A6H2ELT5_9ACTO|nr:phage/plasmid primase, P4 family [Arcanobacterium buesumense]QJC22022.1 DNA primase [Arcanobacterium buesumense]